MKKLRLGLEELQVQSFATTPEFRNRAGTVHGREEADGTWTDCPPGCITDIRTDNQSECFPSECPPGCITEIGTDNRDACFPDQPN